MTDEHDNFKIGDVVTWSHRHGVGRSKTLRGSIVKVTAAMVVAKPDYLAFEEKRFRRRKYTPFFECRKVDVAREQWHRDLEAWWEARPTTQILEMSPRIQFEGASVRVVRDSGWIAATHDSMEALAAEAYAIREWLRKRPEESK